jgi:hypothetical protein
MQADPAKGIENRLWAIAQSSASGYGFEPNCEVIVRALVHGGAQRIVAEGFANDYAQIALAERNLSRYISEMIVEAHRLGYTELHEDTEGKARSTLCPLWPFC